MKLIIRTMLIAFAMALSACTTFDRAWAIWSPKNLKPQGGALGLGPRTVKQSPFDGQWAGHWTSDRRHFPNGKPESGDLKLVISKEDTYRWLTYVRANWLVFRTDYKTFLYGQQHENRLVLHGQEDVAAIFGGPYRYNGTVTPTKFTLRYSSPYDEGTVELVRPY